MIRLDKFISENFEATRTQAVKLIEAGNCTVNGVVVSSKKYLVKEDDRVEVEIPPPEICEALPEDIPLDVCYEDSDVIVVNKPKGMVVHPAVGHHSGTLVNALMWKYRDCDSQLERAGIVHRLDKDTSGLLAVAKTEKAHLSLSEQLKNRTITREYEAVVNGRVKQTFGEVNAPIGRSVSDRKKMCVTTKGTSREALTYYEVVEVYDRFTHLRLRLNSGRTHQIRVHMSYIGHSVAGDSVYGNGKPTSLNGQCLHAKRLVFIHPGTGNQVEVISDLPSYFTEFVNEIK
jgi:23S rRNA pseudouridine1911/1915/1917 synthase